MGKNFWGWGFCALMCLAAPSHALTQIDEELRAVLGKRQESVSVIAHLSGQYDLRSIPKGLKSRDEKIDFIVRALKSYHQEKSQPLRAYLLSHKNKVSEITSIWISNSLRIKASADLIQDFAALNGIERLSLNIEKAIDELDPALASKIVELWGDPEPQMSWGVDLIGAPQLWNAYAGMNITGKGVKAAVIDTGVNTQHPDLAAQIYRNAGESGLDANGTPKEQNGVDDDNNGFVDDYQGWNFEHKNNDVTDATGHGSKVAGIIAGNGSSGIITGVAPETTIVPIKVCYTVFETAVFESCVWEGLQYALLAKVHLLSMSISVKEHSKPSYEQWRRVDEVLLAAGIVHVNSAGNTVTKTPGKNIGAPPSNPSAWLHPAQDEKGGLSAMLTIGATDEKDVVQFYSATGPATWENVPGYNDYLFDGGKRSGLIKPELCAPSEVPSTSQFGAAYTNSFGGTSSAAPNAAGVVALLLSYNPKLTVSQITEAMMMGAKSLNASSTLDNECGAGRVDAVGAIEYARIHFPASP